MTKREILQKLEQTRKEYKVARKNKDKESMKRLKTFGEALVRYLDNLCRECKDSQPTVDHYPFCSKLCNERWGRKNWGTVKRRPTVAEMQKRLLEHAKRKHLEKSIDVTGQRKITI